ncbi:hypothetical protein FCM35_KLT22321 [Carex littledalei]|uniref:Uncharacterized protein n=1 Tax=Carex littledalei TaxID=544730 RepID=A0A833QBT1_9POAL|nr:hypothetical protein FCM35_KLT22321 [Carex littledalei]
MARQPRRSILLLSISNGATTSPIASKAACPGPGNQCLCNTWVFCGDKDQCKDKFGENAQFTGLAVIGLSDRMFFGIGMI